MLIETPLPFGSLVNAGAIILGSLAGLALGGRFSERLQTTVFQALGLAVIVIGLQMALKLDKPLHGVFSLVAGGLLGETLRLHEGLERLGEALKARLKSGNPRFTEGFVSATLLYCVGSMAIVGSFDEGLRGDSTVLLTKSILDGFASIPLAASLGSGVIFSFAPTLAYQGGLTLLAGVVQSFLTPELIGLMSAVGGALILGIGLNLLQITRLRLVNFLPALPFSILLGLVFS